MINILYLKNWLHPLVGLLLTVFSSGGEAEGVKLKVVIAEGAPKVVVSGEGLGVKVAGRKWHPGNRIKIKTRGKALDIGGRTFRKPVRVTTDADFLYVDGRQYRGDIIVHGGKGGLLVVDELPLETYLVGLINAEAHSSWPREAIRAQAVAARSYAMLRIDRSGSRSFDLRATVADQVYLGSALEDPAAADAVRSTRGEVLSFGGRVAKAFYHSTCGGRTAGVKEVWGGDFPYLRSVECDWCQESPRYFWRYQIDGMKISAALARSGIKVGSVKEIKIVGKTPSGRNDKVKIVGGGRNKIIKASTLRKTLGYTNIFSTRFEVFEPDAGKFLFMGRGSGHGVGMCQWGARGMAALGKKYREVLLYYYPGCSIMKAY